MLDSFFSGFQQSFIKNFSFQKLMTLLQKLISFLLQIFIPSKLFKIPIRILTLYLKCIIWLLSCFILSKPKPSLSPDFLQTISHPNGFINPTANQCFANALLQCLYHLSDFKKLVLNSQDSPNQALNLLAKLFQAMGSPSTSQKEIYQIKDNLIQTLIQNNPEVLYFPDCNNSE